MKYTANWHRNKRFGNAVKSGAKLNVKISGAVIVSGAIYKKTWYGHKMLQAQQGKNKISFLLKQYKNRKVIGYDTGHYTLKISAYNSKYQHNLWRDNFFID